MAMRLSEKDDIALSISPQCSNGSQELQKKYRNLLNCGTNSDLPVFLMPVSSFFRLGYAS